MEEFLLLKFQRERGALGHLNMVPVACTRPTEFAGQMKNQVPGRVKCLAGHSRLHDVPPALLTSANSAKEGGRTSAMVAREETWREHQMLSEILE